MKKKMGHLLIVLGSVFLICSVLLYPSLAGAANIITGNSPVLERVVSRGVLRVGVNPGFKPFSFINEKKERVGVDIDIAKLLARGLGVKLEIVVPKSFSELIPMLLEDRIDIIIAGMTRNFKRAKVVDFTDSYFDTGLSIMFNKVAAVKSGIPIAQSYEELMEKLKEAHKEDKLIIAVTKGKSPARSVPHFFPKATVIEYPTNEAAAEAVAQGKAHIMVHDEMFLKIWVQDNKDKTMFKVFVFKKPFKPDYYSFAVKKDNQEFLNMLNVFIKELYVEGYFKKFMKKYLD